MCSRRQYGLATGICCSILYVIAALFFSTHSYATSQNLADEKARPLLVAYMSLDTMFSDEKVRALAEAAGEGNVEEVEELVAQGVDVNSKGTSNVTPLFWAMHNINGFKKLLELGADPNVIFDDGGSVIHWAVRVEDEKFLEEALKHGGNPNLVAGPLNETPLFRAATPEGKSKASIMLNAGADINAQRVYRDTPIMIAARLGQFDLVYELLERGADFSIKDENGNDLLYIISIRKRRMDPKNELTRWMEKVIEWLNKRGAYLPQ